MHLESEQSLFCSKIRGEKRKKKKEILVPVARSSGEWPVLLVTGTQFFSFFPTDFRAKERLLAVYCVLCEVYLNIISGKDSSPSIQFTVNPVLVHLPPHADDVAFPEGQLPDKLSSNSMKFSSIYKKNTPQIL